MKKCPKCKSSEVKKTHSEKYVCKMCGFSQVSLEVVSEGDDFQ